MPHSGLSLCEARRVALAAQGFDRPRPSGRVGKRDLRRTIRQLGLLQIRSGTSAGGGGSLAGVVGRRYSRLQT
jgi:uncharacterized protein YcaQ